LIKTSSIRQQSETPQSNYTQQKKIMVSKAVYSPYTGGRELARYEAAQPPAAYFSVRHKIWCICPS
jgi:hypothetical protein